MISSKTTKGLERKSIKQMNFFMGGNENNGERARKEKELEIEKERNEK